jgi:hypothetical protein
VPVAGQSVQLIHDIPPAKEIIDRVVADTADAFAHASRLHVPNSTRP